MFNWSTVKDVDVNGKTVLVRVDYNIPLENGQITSDLRVRASLPTIQYLKEHGAKKIILISHLGRPKGVEPESSLRSVAAKLQELLPAESVQFVPEIHGDVVKQVVADAPNGGILLLENLRFLPGEKQDSAEFAQSIKDSTGAELFVQDGFGVVHRGAASTVAITNILPSVAGLLVEKEVGTLTKVASDPDHPVLVIIGGSKVEDKQPLIDKFLPVADKIIVGGKIAADGYVPSNEKIYVAEDFATDEAGAKLDIGEKSIAYTIDLINSAKTVIWNGLVGLAEQPPFDHGSKQLAEAIGRRTDLTSVICGGDTAGFAENLQAADPSLHYSLISTGGGASLSLLSGESLPGVESLAPAK